MLAFRGRSETRALPSTFGGEEHITRPSSVQEASRSLAYHPQKNIDLDLCVGS